MAGLRAVAIVAATLCLAGCAGITGITNWKEQTLTTKLSEKAAFHAATIALAQTGQVTFSDVSAGAISGQCAQYVDASIIVASTGGQTSITLKSKINLPGSEVAIDTGDREQCLDKLATALKRQGV